MRFSITILGCNSALPAYGRFPTSQALNVSENLYLIDCGEGTQIQLNKFGIRRNRINQIFISHLHGDHVFGLMGILTSFSLSGRKKRLHIFSPAGLEEMIEVQVRLSHSKLSYPLEFHEIDTSTSSIIFEDKLLEVTSIPLKHRIPTTGYLFKEKRKPFNIIAEKLEMYQVPFTKITDIKNGKDFIHQSGKIISNKEFTMPPVLPRSYAFCSDTMYTESIIPIINGADLLYHETTYCHDLAERAKETMHSTALEAATIAKKAKVGKLITGHYSSRYAELSPILEEAKSVFQNVELGLEGRTFEVAMKRATKHF